MFFSKFRNFSVLDSLKNLRIRSHDEKFTELVSFMTKYSEFVSKNSIDLDCCTSELTPQQTQRCDFISEEFIKLNSLQLRVFFYILNETEKNNFIYKPDHPISADLTPELFSQGLWPTLHPQNIKFQQELGELGLLGLHGFPKDFIDKLISGQATQTLEEFKEE